MSEPTHPEKRWLVVVGALMIQVILGTVYAFSVFGNTGRMYGAPVSAGQRRAGYRELNPVAILRVENRNGDVRYAYDQPESRDVLSPQLAYLMTHILSDETARWPSLGHPNPLEIGRPAGAKDKKQRKQSGYFARWAGRRENAPVNDSE